MLITCSMTNHPVPGWWVSFIKCLIYNCLPACLCTREVCCKTPFCSLPHLSVPVEEKIDYNVFERFPHQLLIQKLNFVDMVTDLAHYIPAYSENRNRFVEIRGSCSSYLDVISGIGSATFFYMVSDIALGMDTADDHVMYCRWHVQFKSTSRVITICTKKKTWTIPVLRTIRRNESSLYNLPIFLNQLTCDITVECTTKRLLIESFKFNLGISITEFHCHNDRLCFMYLYKFVFQLQLYICIRIAHLLLCHKYFFICHNVYYSIV